MARWAEGRRQDRQREILVVLQRECRKTPTDSVLSAGVSNNWVASTKMAGLTSAGKRFFAPQVVRFDPIPDRHVFRHSQRHGSAAATYCPRLLRFTANCRQQPFCLIQCSSIGRILTVDPSGFKYMTWYCPGSIPLSFMSLAQCGWLVRPVATHVTTQIRSWCCCTSHRTSFTTNAEFMVVGFVVMVVRPDTSHSTATVQVLFVAGYASPTLMPPTV